MGEEERAIQLEQLANIVIDAYLNRDKRFKPDFGDNDGIMYLCRPGEDWTIPIYKSASGMTVTIMRRKVVREKVEGPNSKD